MTVLKKKYPKIYAELHPSLNKKGISLKLDQDCKIKVWWKCKSKKCGHNWKDTVYGRVVMGRNCPKCEERNKTRRTADKFDIKDAMQKISNLSVEVKKCIDKALDETLSTTIKLKGGGQAKTRLIKIKKLCILLREAISNQKNLDIKEVERKKKKKLGIKKCDMCGKEFVGKAFPILDENFNKKEGLIQCEECVNNLNKEEEKK